jgi:hypothetical protein
VKQSHLFVDIVRLLYGDKGGSCFDSASGS